MTQLLLELQLDVGTVPGSMSDESDTVVELARVLERTVTEVPTVGTDGSATRVTSTRLVGAARGAHIDTVRPNGRLSGAARSSTGSDTDSDSGGSKTGRARVDHMSLPPLPSFGAESLLDHNGEAYKRWLHKLEKHAELQQ